MEVYKGFENYHFIHGQTIQDLPCKNEADLIINAAIDINKYLGYGFQEIVCKVVLVSSSLIEDVFIKYVVL